jgi:hypothetical protein
MVRLNALIAAFVLLIAGSALRAGAAPGPTRVTSIQGNAWTAENAPIAHARLRLRDVSSGKIQAVTIANEAGQFTFGNIEPGSYAVELVNDSAAVLAVGHVFSIAPGEVVATFVRLGTRVPWFSGFFGNAAAAVASSAASQGITALAPIPRPASAGR